MFLVARSINVSPIRAQERLIQLGIPSYCPREAVWVRQHRNAPDAVRRLHHKPLFPSYLFIIGSETGMKAGEALRPHGYVIRFVQLAGRFISLTPSEILSISRTEEEIRQLAMQREKRPVFGKGEAVSIMKGVLSGARVKIRDVRGRQALVDVVSMPGSAPVFVSLSDLS